MIILLFYLRVFLKELRDRGTTTLLLTSHDLDDVSALCPRVMLVAEGKLLHDGPMETLITRLGGQRTLKIQLATPTEPLPPLNFPPQVSTQWLPPQTLILRFQEPLSAHEVLSAVLNQLEIQDFHLQEPAIEELVARFYEKKS